MKENQEYEKYCPLHHRMKTEKVLVYENNTIKLVFKCCKCLNNCKKNKIKSEPGKLTYSK